MKRCPQCHRAYTDDTLRFCLDDGAPLSASDPPDITQRAATSRRDDPQTEVLPARLFNPQPSKPSSVPAYVYVLGSLLVVTIVLIVAGVGIVAWLNLRGTDSPPVSNKRSDNLEQRGTPTPTPIASPSVNPLTRLLIGTWTWNTFSKSFSSDGTGIYYDDGKKCFNFKYEIIGNVLRMTVDGAQQCGSGGGDYRISIDGDNMRHEYVGNGFVTDWKRVR